LGGALPAYLTTVGFTFQNYHALVSTVLPQPASCSSAGEVERGCEVGETALSALLWRCSSEVSSPWESPHPEPAGPANTITAESQMCPVQCL